MCLLDKSLSFVPHLFNGVLEVVDGIEVLFFLCCFPHTKNKKIYIKPLTIIYIHNMITTFFRI